MHILIAAILGLVIYERARRRGAGFWRSWACALAIMLPIWIVGDMLFGRVFWEHLP